MLRMSRMNAKSLLISAATTLVIAAGCHTAADFSVGSAATTSATLNQSGAADQIVKAHCTHFYGCNELGGKNQFRDYDACERQMKQETLHGQQCQNKTIDSKKLTACLDSIRTSTCGRAHSERFQACSEQTLCR